MDISIIGGGYVGTVTGAGFSELGHRVTIVDTDADKVEALNQGRAPVYEPGLEELLVKNSGKIRATTVLQEAIRDSDLSFICVGTPSAEDGSIDLSYVVSAAKEIGEEIAHKKNHVVVVKSTVLPGTTEQVVKAHIEMTSRLTAFRDFGLASNPEFLREGNAVYDFFNPDRIVIGSTDEKTRALMDALYSSFSCPIFHTAIQNAEMIKYVSNAFLATKISFANEIGNLCKLHGIDVDEVFEGVGMDHRISPEFFRAGIGFGGSCFPKDVKALVVHGDRMGSPLNLLKSVMEVNERQPLRMIGLLTRHLNPKGRTIGILGLAFKPGTDDIRESRAIPVIDVLQQMGADIVAYDPKATEHFARVFPDIRYAQDPLEVLEADAILIITEWDEFGALDYTGKIVIDGRHIEQAKKSANIYEGVCWP
jgi:UDPglucose 6-dehydrogenase